MAVLAAWSPIPATFTRILTEPLEGALSGSLRAEPADSAAVGAQRHYGVCQARLTSSAIPEAQCLDVTELIGCSWPGLLAVSCKQPKHAISGYLHSRSAEKELLLLLLFFPPASNVCPELIIASWLFFCFLPC